MIVLPSTRQRIARVPLLLRAHDSADAAGDYALSYGRRQALTFTRAGAARMTDQVGQHGVLPSGMLRRSAVAVGLNRVLAFELEPAGANLVTESRNFGAWSSFGATVTADVALGADGTLTVDRLAAAGSSADSRARTVIFTGNGTKAFGVWLRAGTATASGFSLYDATDTVVRHAVRVTWTAGVPALTTDSGAGTRFPVEYHFATGLWRCHANATGVVAANTNQLLVYPDLVGTTGTVLAWEAQAEDGFVLTSSMPSAASAGTRAVERLSAPIAFGPRACTLYVRFVERGSAFAATDPGVLSLGAAFGTSLFIAGTGGGGYNLIHRRAVDVFSGVSGVSVGDIVELRGRFNDDGVVTLACSLNGGDEVVGTPSAASDLAASWNESVAYFNSRGVGLEGTSAITHAAVAFGAPSRDELRDLCEVG